MYKKMSFEISDTTDRSSNHIFRAVNNANTGYPSFGIWGDTNSFFKFRMGYGSEVTVTTIPCDNKIHNIVYMHNKVIIDDKLYEFNDTWNEIKTTITVFTTNGYNYGYYIPYSKMKLYEFRFTENEIITHDLIPCQSTVAVTDINGKQCPANTKGLYDLVEGKFYTNQGSGEDFIAGPEV